MPSSVAGEGKPIGGAQTGNPNHPNVAAHVALEKASINIPDIYHADGFDFFGTKAFDNKLQQYSTHTSGETRGGEGEKLWSNLP